MSWKAYLLIFIAGILVLGFAAIFQTSPGYMDAEYYAAIAKRIARGYGLTEPFVWNYFGGVGEIPQPAFRYWMPLTSFMTAFSFWLWGSVSFRAGQFIFLVMGITIPPLTAKLAYKMSDDNKVGLFSGLIAAFSGFYPPFLTTTDSFTIYMVSGLLFILLLGEKQTSWRFVVLGFLAGLMHITRAEGFLWVAAILLGVYLMGQFRPLFLFWAAAGYGVVLLPWMIRNLIEFGTVLNSNGWEMLWLTSYNDLFSYPVDKINFHEMVSQGINQFLIDRLIAGWTNLQTFLIVQGQIILIPLLVIGLWKHGSQPRIKIGCLMLAAMYFVMTVLFPYAGARGGFFHAGASVQALLWSVAGLGLKELVRWGNNKRKWRKKQAWLALGSGWVLISLVMTVFLINQRVIGSDWNNPVWNSSYRTHLKIAEVMDTLKPHPQSVVMVNNPPGMYYATGYPAIVIPNGGIETLEKAAKDYQVDYIILEMNHPPQLNALYENPRSTEQLVYLLSAHEVRFFTVEGTDP